MIHESRPTASLRTSGRYSVHAVETPFFSILADDDVILPGFYERATAGFSEHPEAMFVAMTTLDVNDSGTVLGGAGTTGSFAGRFCAAGEAYGRAPGVWTGWVFRREVVRTIGFIQQDAGPACDIGFLRHVTIRASIRRFIENMYVGGLRSSVMTSLIDGRSEFALETTRILRRLGYPMSASALRAVSRRFESRRADVAALLHGSAGECTALAARVTI